MPYRETKPTGPLSCFIEAYWQLNDPVPGNHNSFIPADGTFNLVHVPVATTLLGRSAKINLDSGFNIIPQQQTSLTIKHRGLRVTGIRFKAFAWENVTKSTNGIKHKHRILVQSDCWEEQVHELEHTATNMLESAPDIDQELRAKINYLLEHKGDVSIREMQDHFDVSKQWLHRIFKEKTGLSPKSFANVWRLNNFLLLARQKTSLTRAALDAGYYDQAHCINSFQNHYSTSPSGFIRSKSNTLLAHYETIANRFNNYYDPC